MLQHLRLQKVGMNIMELLTSSQMQEIDKEAGNLMPSVLLMEHAAYQIFSYIKEQDNGKSVVIVCGPGNNGGDGLALARQLTIWSSCPVTVILLTSPKKLTMDGQTYYKICHEMGINIIELDAYNKLDTLDKLKNAEIIVDAIFGTGLSRPVEGIFKEMICKINNSSAKVISVDVPSGIDANTGKILEVAIYADITITFFRAKIGLYLYPAFLYTKEVKVVDIGIPKHLLNLVQADYYSIDKETVRHFLPQRPIRSNKGTFGKVLAVGGSLGMLGAICLTSYAAYHVGCGIVTVVVPKSLVPIVQAKLTEAMAIGLEEEAGHFKKNAGDQLKTLLTHTDVIAIGPGMDRHENTLLESALQSDKPCIVDADALYFLPQYFSVLQKRTASTIITPHPGEMARLINTSIDDILENPIYYAKYISQKYHLITVLKLERTIISDTNGTIYVNCCGNTGLAKGGSGDTLTGILAGLIAQKIEPIKAVQLGVYLHSKSADIAKEKFSAYSYMASDIIRLLGSAILDLS